MTVQQWALKHGWLHSPVTISQAEVFQVLKRLDRANRLVNWQEIPDDLRAFYSEALTLGISVAGMLDLEVADEPA